MINTLVTHKKKNLGIGCISKEHKNNVTVNFGLYDTQKCKLADLNIVDLSECKTVSFSEFKNRILRDKSTLNDAIVGNEKKHYVGIGWVTDRVVTFDDLKKYPRVI